MLKSPMNLHDIKITDFQFTKKIEDVTPGDEKVGSIHYVSPEVFIVKYITMTIVHSSNIAVIYLYIINQSIMIINYFH